MPSQTDLSLKNVERMEEDNKKDGRRKRWVDPIDGSDSNNGKNRYKAMKTVQAAVDDIEDVGSILMLSGDTDENVVVDDANIVFEGVIRDGAKRSAITPTTGVPLTLNQGYCEVCDIALVAQDDHALYATGPDHKFQTLYLEVNSAKYAAWLDDADRAQLKNLFIEGNGTENAIGVLIGDGTIDAVLQDSYLTGFGSGIGGAGLNGNAVRMHAGGQNALIHRNQIYDNYVGIFVPASSTGYDGYAIMHNTFSEISNYDVYDANNPDTYGTEIRENTYLYTGWYVDNNNDSRADLVIDAYANKDHSPLRGMHSWRCAPIPRMNVI